MNDFRKLMESLDSILEDNSNKIEYARDEANTWKADVNNSNLQIRNLRWGSYAAYDENNNLVGEWVGSFDKKADDDVKNAHGWLDSKYSSLAKSSELGSD